jgi:hypothetical protein
MQSGERNGGDDEIAAHKFGLAPYAVSPSDTGNVVEVVAPVHAHINTSLFRPNGS